MPVLSKPIVGSFVVSMVAIAVGIRQVSLVPSRGHVCCVVCVCIVDATSTPPLLGNNHRKGTSCPQQLLMSKTSCLYKRGVDVLNEWALMASLSSV